MYPFDSPRNWLLAFFVPLTLFLPLSSLAGAGQLRGTVVDEATGNPVPCRLYIESADGKSYFASSADPAGSAIKYDVQRSPESYERHVTLSPHPFSVDLPPGNYTLIAERGKEYIPVRRSLEITDQPAEVKLTLKRWINMADLGWFSGDTHVHRPVRDCPNLVLAEDLNVALPITYWVREAYVPPIRVPDEPDPAPKLISVDPTHVIYPVNTEYELFTVSGKQHMLGAVFVLNHKSALRPPAPPVVPIAQAAREQGALLDLDKHTWPWSIMVAPLMQVDLFELANNHHWRVPFTFKQWTIESLPKNWNIETDQGGWTEWGWTDFGFKTYYAFLNSGFPMRPTGGTGAGVHPVPLGFGRVYVNLNSQAAGGQKPAFSYEKWIAGLNAGNSFVTTGPMLFTTVNQQVLNTPVKLDRPGKVTVSVRTTGIGRFDRAEIIRNGDIVATIKPDSPDLKTSSDTYSLEHKHEIDIDESSWIAVRTFESQVPPKLRFAHSAPVYISVPGKPLRPRKIELDYFIDRLNAQIERNKDVLAPAEVAEYRSVLKNFESMLPSAR